jgi:tRNA(Phe) wybutosine-synthesizing methylase Tyw3
MNKPQELWQKKKSDLLAVINETMEQGNVDKDVLEIMKELIDNAIVKSSMEDYFDDLE